MRKKMVVGNWKMNTTVEEGKELLTELMNQEISSEAQIVICPPFVHLSALSALVEPLGYISIGAQNCSKFEEGAYTGEVSALMLKEYVEFIIVGHSERRVVFNESNEDIKEKIQMILSHHIKPIFCCGESISIRNEGKHIDFVLNQIKESLFFLDKIDFENSIAVLESEN